MQNPTCPLCKSSSTPFEQENYYCCNTCKGIFVPKEKQPSLEAEKGRYEEHNNDENDTNYQNFVSPITNTILKDFSPQDKGLDFGSGKSSSISKVLKDHNYSIEKYDPFFHNNPELLTKKYNYIACCEVIEHFFDPAKEFELLKAMLAENGALICMTHLYNDTIDFKNWYYRRDKTHVFIYQAETIKWIKNEFGFAKVQIENRLIQFLK